MIDQNPNGQPKLGAPLQTRPYEGRFAGNRNKFPVDASGGVLVENQNSCLTVLDAAGADPPVEPAFGELFPIMSSFVRDEAMKNGLPFSDVLVLGRLHLTTSAVAALDALKAWGLKASRAVFFHKAYPYAHRDLVLESLRRRGARVLPDSEMTLDCLRAIADESDNKDVRILTLEDGAHLVERIHEDNILTARWIGGAEQTTRGTWAIDRLMKEGKLSKPVSALSNSKVKQEFEAPRIAQSGRRAIENLFPHICVGDWNVAVIGAGAVGRHTIAAFKALGCSVAAFDPAPAARLCASHLPDRLARFSAVDAARDAHLIVGTAGCQTISPDVIAAGRPHLRIGSMSSEQVEIDCAYLERQADHTEPLLLHPAGFPNNPRIGTRYFLPPRGSRLVDVIFDSMPLNFSEFGIMCERHADFIVSWLMLCALDIVRGKFAGHTGALRDAGDQVLRDYKIIEQYERIWA